MKVGQQPIQLPGFCLAGLFCVGLAVVKLTAEGHWSWWRVLLPLWVILGHNALWTKPLRGISLEDRPKHLQLRC